MLDSHIIPAEAMAEANPLSYRQASLQCTAHNAEEWRVKGCVSTRKGVWAREQDIKSSKQPIWPR